MICLIMVSALFSFAQLETDSLPAADSIPVKKIILVPEFKLIDADTITLGEHDEMICDSYTAIGVPAVYDALHSFNRRRMDYFGGYLNVKINAALERVRSKGFPSDVKHLFVQIDPKNLTVHWIAVVGPSEDGKCYACVDSRGSANGGLPAVHPQLNKMHNLYPNMQPELLLDFNDDVIQCFEWNGTPLTTYCTYINIRQLFYKYATNCVDPATNSVLVDISHVNTGKDTFQADGSDAKKVIEKPIAPVYKKYKVKSGDTLSEIALRHRTTVTAIKRLNNLRSDRIDIGQILKLPL